MSELDRVTQAVLARAAGMVLYARQRLGGGSGTDVSAAEDVVQEALASLLAQRPLPDDPVAWMYRAIRNAAIDESRASARRRRREQAVAETRREWFDARPDTLIDAQSAERALGRLAPEQREIVVLRIWGELGFAEIARIMQVSVSTAHQRYAAALQQMRITLEKPCRNSTTT
jgi:RNA polymerase sigma-70 factor (ECF subfamily)